MAYSDVALLIVLSVAVALAYPTKDDEAYYNRLHEFQDSYGKDVRNLDGIDARDEASPLFNFLSKTQESDDSGKGPNLKFDFGSSSHLDGIGGGHLVRDSVLNQGLEPDLDLLPDNHNAYMGNHEAFGVVRKYPERSKVTLKSEGNTKRLVYIPQREKLTLNCIRNEHCADGTSFDYTKNMFLNNEFPKANFNKLSKQTTDSRMIPMNTLTSHFPNTKRSLDSIGGGNLLNARDVDISPLFDESNLLHYNGYLDSKEGGNILIYRKDLDSIGGGHILNYKKDLDSIGGGHLLHYRKDLDSIGGGHLLSYKKDLDSIGGGHLLSYKKDLDSIGGGHLLSYKKDLDSIGGGHLLNYRKDLDSIGGGHLLSYKKDLDSIGGGHLLNYRKDLDSIGGGHLLQYRKDLDSIGGGHLLSYRKDLDSIGGGHLLNYKKDLESIGGGHLLSYKKDLDSIGGGHLLSYRKDLDPTEEENWRNEKDLHYVDDGHLFTMKKLLDSPLLSGRKGSVGHLSGDSVERASFLSPTQKTYTVYYKGAGLPLKSSRPLCSSSMWFQNMLYNYNSKEAPKGNTKKILHTNKIYVLDGVSKNKNIMSKEHTPRLLNKQPEPDGINTWMKGLYGSLSQTTPEDQTELPFSGIIELNKVYIPTQNDR